MSELDNQGDVWEVFIQSKPGLAHKHVGNTHAADKEMALQNARDLYTRRQEGTSIWVVPTSAVTVSSPDDAASFYEPSNDKMYRHPTYYVMPEGAEHI
jgi:ring-1,2-phenylacetyl-CoA epoxidase subunit PaaB